MLAVEPGFLAGADPATRMETAVNSPAAPCEGSGMQARPPPQLCYLPAGTADVRGWTPLKVGVGGTAVHTQTLPCWVFRKEQFAF